MPISLAPILLAIELSCMFVLTWRTSRLAPAEGTLKPVYVYLLWVTAYSILASILGALGVYISEDILKLLPGFWLLLIPVAVCVFPVVLCDSVRNGMRRIADNTPWHWFAYFHGLRIAALGTAYKTMIGEFPASFETVVGIPDLLFGISAFWMAGKAKRGEISNLNARVFNRLYK